MDNLTALIEAAALPVILTAGIGFCVWLVKGFLTQTTEHIEKLLDRDRASFNEKFGHIEKLLDRDRASFNEKFGHIDKQFETINKQLSNHITETNKKIDKLAEGQAKLEVKILDGQAKLEVKIAEGQAELYKLLSSKSPEKKQ